MGYQRFGGTCCLWQQGGLNVEAVCTFSKTVVPTYQTTRSHRKEWVFTFVWFVINLLQSQLQQRRKSTYEVKSETEFPLFWVETKRGLMFGHRSFTFPRSYQSCSNTNYSVRWDFPVPGSGRRPRIHFWTLALMVREVATSDVFFQFAKQWQSEVAKSRLYGGWRTRCQWQVSRGQWVVWIILGQAISCSGSTLVSRPGLWHRVAPLGVETSPYSQLESPSHHASWYLRKRSRVCPRVCCHHLTVV
jgi:hypothetical protein